MKKGCLIKATTLILVMSVAMVGCGKKGKKDDSNKETETQSVVAEATTDKTTSVATTSAATVAPTEATTEATTEVQTEEEKENEVAADEGGLGDGGNYSEPENNGGDAGSSEPDPTPQPQENPAPQPQQSSGPDLSWYGESNPGSKTGCYDGFDYDPSQIYSRIMAMKNYYPEGMSWTGANTYFNGRLPGGEFGTFWGGGGCNAFACMLSDAAFGNREWSTHSNIDAVKVGDVIDYWNDTDHKLGHVFIVIGMETKMVTSAYYVPEINEIVIGPHTSTVFICAEGNRNSKVYWGEEREISDLKSNYHYTIYTRY